MNPQLKVRTLRKLKRLTSLNWPIKLKTPKMKLQTKVRMFKKSKRPINRKNQVKLNNPIILVLKKTKSSSNLNPNNQCQINLLQKYLSFNFKTLPRQIQRFLKAPQFLMINFKNSKNWTRTHPPSKCFKITRKRVTKKLRWKMMVKKIRGRRTA